MSGRHAAPLKHHLSPGMRRPVSGMMLYGSADPGLVHLQPVARQLVTKYSHVDPLLLSPSQCAS